MYYTYGAGRDKVSDALKPLHAAQAPAVRVATERGHRVFIWFFVVLSIEPYSLLILQSETSHLKLSITTLILCLHLLPAPGYSIKYLFIPISDVVKFRHRLSYIMLHAFPGCCYL